MSMDDPSIGLASLIDRLSRLLHSKGYSNGLYPAHWVSLRFFAEATPSSRTTASLARFQGMSLGPVARTVRVLVGRGLLARAANPSSRRADLITVTTAGRTLLNNDPRAIVATVIRDMPADEREALANAVERLIDKMWEPANNESQM